ncbi:MAG TPA: DUF2269 family protein [Tepidiformaceae bacterium]|nr:DUF2269 family protein [Tepidiformaceae bacterium]
MSTSEWYLFGHLLGVFLMLAAAGLTTGTAIAVARATSAKVVVTLLDLMRASELYITSAGVVLVLVFGMLLIDKRDFSFGDGWISAAFTLLIVVLAVDHGFLMRRNRKSRALAASLGDGPVNEELRTMLNDRLTTVVGVLLDLSFVVFLWLMIAKPGA